MTSLQEELEKSYFKASFSEIKENSLIKDLKLTDKEIIENRTLIKKVIENHHKCGDNKNFCLTLSTHYSLKRNSDNRIILTTFDCEKTRHYISISDKEINDQIKKLLYSPSCSFDNEKAKVIIKKLLTYKNGYLNELLKNIGNPKYKILNSYIITDTKKEISIIYAYHMILTGEQVDLLKSNELKEICIENAFNFKKHEMDSKSNKYKKICESKNLIIVDLGLENETNKHAYYTDLLPDLLNLRKESNKSTHIMSPMNLNVLLEEISKIKKGSALVNKHKLDNLKNTMDTFFGRIT